MFNAMAILFQYTMILQGYYCTLLKYSTIYFTAYSSGTITTLWFFSGFGITMLFYYLMDFDFELSDRHSNIMNDSFASDFDEIE